MNYSIRQTDMAAPKIFSTFYDHSDEEHFLSSGGNTGNLKPRDSAFVKHSMGMRTAFGYQPRLLNGWGHPRRLWIVLRKIKLTFLVRYVDVQLAQYGLANDEVRQALRFLWCEQAAWIERHRFFH